MLRIGFDAKRLFNNFTGLGNYSRTLLRNLVTFHPGNAYFLYTPRVTQNEETHFFFNSALFNVRVAPHRFHSYWRTYGLRSALHKHKIQLYHGLSHEIPVGLDRLDIRSVVTIHDLVFKHYPEYYSLPDRAIYNFKFRYACRRADRIIAISESTKRDIMAYYNVPASKISVIYQSCHERFFQEKSPETRRRVRDAYQLPAAYLLYVGSVIPRKNLLAVVQAMRALPAALQLPLVVVGEGKSYLKKVKAFLQEHRLESQVYFIRPAAEALPAIYQQAAAFIYPSFYEGFGIPVLEALFSRTPVITSNVSSLPEAGGPGAALIDPHRPEAIAEQLEMILDDSVRREKMIETGYDYAQRFRGEPLTEQLVAVYEALTGEGRSLGA